MRRMPAFLRQLSVVIFAISVTSCSAINSFTSEAYRLGVVSGQGYGYLGEYAGNVTTWLPEENGLPSEPLIQGDQATVAEYCIGIWPALGLTSGLENSESNKRDFVAGCLDGAGF
jgi:hypothetical protein